MEETTSVFDQEPLETSVVSLPSPPSEETTSKIPEKINKKRGRKRKSEKQATITDETNGPRPVKRGRGRPPRSAQLTSNALPLGSVPANGEPEGANAARERSRVKTLRDAFLELQRSLPSVPPDTKLSKLDVLVLATTYISHLMKTLDEGDSTVVNSEDSKISEKQHRLKTNGLLHPVKKWPMRSRLYAGAGGIPMPPVLDAPSPSSASV